MLKKSYLIKMVYKKYLKKGGKIFGPYYYESYRQNGKVKKIYIGGKSAYKLWLKLKKKEKKTRKKNRGVVEQPKISRKSKKNPGKFLFILFLMVLILVIGINIGNFINLASYSFTGFVVSENVSEGTQNNLLYGTYEDEVIVEQFDTDKINLDIKEAPKFAGEKVSKNKNKRMDFEIPEGNLRLYFDLLNYSEFVSSVESIITEEIAEKAPVEKPEETTEETEIEEEIETNATEEVNNSEISLNETESEFNVTEEPEIKTNETESEFNVTEEPEIKTNETEQKK